LVWGLDKKGGINPPSTLQDKSKSKRAMQKKGNTTSPLFAPYRTKKGTGSTGNWGVPCPIVKRKRQQYAEQRKKKSNRTSRQNALGGRVRPKGKRFDPPVQVRGGPFLSKEADGRTKKRGRGRIPQLTERGGAPPLSKEKKGAAMSKKKEDAGLHRRRKKYLSFQEGETRSEKSKSPGREKKKTGRPSTPSKTNSRPYLPSQRKKKGEDPGMRKVREKRKKKKNGHMADHQVKKAGPCCEVFPEGKRGRGGVGGITGRKEKRKEERDGVELLRVGWKPAGWHR